jgi:hypothetical protein
LIGTPIHLRVVSLTKILSERDRELLERKLLQHQAEVRNANEALVRYAIQLLTKRLGCIKTAKFLFVLAPFGRGRRIAGRKELQKKKVHNNIIS